MTAKATALVEQAGIVGQAKEDFPLKLISSLQTKSGFATGELKVQVSGNNAVISGIVAAFTTIIRMTRCVW